MQREIVISIIIVVLVVVLNVITQSYTIQKVETMSQELEVLKEQMIQEEQEGQEGITEKSDNIYAKWTEAYPKLAFYIEHDELEKVNTNLTGLKSYIEVGEYKEGIQELEKCKFILKHIKDKQAIKIENIF